MIVTLLSDFGSRDSYVAEVKAAILVRAPGAALVDVTHEVSPGDVRAAAYLVGRTWRRFPAGTVHLAVVDPGVGTARRALAAEARGYFFVAPDNGVLTSVLAHDATVVSLPVPPGASATFHGRDVFAPAAARLAQGERLRELGEPVADPVRITLHASRFTAGVWSGEVIYVDRFGTLITNLPAAALEDAARVSLGGYAVPVGRTFGDVEPGALIAFAGSGGDVEIAAREASAARRTGAHVGAAVSIETAGGG